MDKQRIPSKEEYWLWTYEDLCPCGFPIESCSRDVPLTVVIEHNLPVCVDHVLPPKDEDNEEE